MKIIGHKKIINLLKKIIEKDGVSHAYLFIGPAGVGKYSVARNFAEMLLETKVSDNFEYINSDLIIMEPEIEEIKGIKKKREIKIEKIRELQHQLSLTSFGNCCRVAIINEAEYLNKSSQNALLKTLEEPGEKLIIILITNDEKMLSTTLVSRCQKIKLGLVDQKEIEKNIPADIMDKREILFWSLGRPGFMRKLAENKDELNFRKESLDELKKLLNQNISEKFILAERMSKDISLAVKKLDLWLVIIREVLLGRQDAIRINPEKSLELIEKIGSSMLLLKQTNSNARLVIENLFLQL